MDAIVNVNERTNDAAEDIESTIPYLIEVKLEGTCDMLFHRWSPDAVESKAKAKKNSKVKKTDNVESYVYRTDDGFLAIPGEYLRMSTCNAAKFRQDPRSPRKSAYDLFKAAVVSMTHLASLGIRDWDYEDRRRVLVQRQGINRVRPAFRKGWTATFELQVLLPEYVSPDVLHDTVSAAGRYIGLADFRPTFGRFAIVGWKVVDLG